MTDSRRGSTEGTSPLTHADAEALISARLDGPLDSGQNRALLGHLASCDRCRAFATQMDMLATAVRDIPSLPPSAAVSRAVRGEIRGETSPVRRFGAWLTTSKSAPLGALAAAVVALALVSASVFGPLGDDGSNGPSVNAPEFAAMETETSAAAAYAGESDDGGGETETAAAPAPNFQVTQTTEAPSSALAAGAAAGGAAESEVQSEPVGSSDDSASTESADSARSAAIVPVDSGAGLADGTGGGNLPIELAIESPEATATETPEPTSTTEPTPTETPEPPATATAEPTEEPAPTETPEPTATEEPAPTETPEPTSTATAEPTATETPATPEPEATSTATPATPEPEATSTSQPVVPRSPESTATATAEPTEEPTPTETPEPEQPNSEGESPAIVSRGGSGQDDSSSDSTSNQSSTQSAGDGTTIVSSAAGAESPTEAVESSETGSSDDSSSSSAIVSSGAGETSSNAAAETSGTIDPATFGDLESVGTMSSSGLLLPGNGGMYAVERAGGGLSIVAADGSVIATGWGYNPVWSEDGQTVYAADGSLAEAGAALISWGAGGGPNYITSGAPAYDTPAGAGNGGLYFIRYQPGAEITMQLRFTGGDEQVIWESSDYALAGQALYLYGGEVYVPTDQGWIAIPTGGGEPRNVGSAIGGEFDQVVDSATGMIAYVSNDTVYIAPATSPGSATSVGSLGNGGFAWTPWGLALASGGTVSIITPDGAATPVVTGGGDLTAPIWTGDALLVSDATDGGTNRRLPADTIGSILGG